MTLFLIVLLAALVFEYINGFHDAANAIATVYGADKIRPPAAPPEIRRSAPARPRKRNG